MGLGGTTPRLPPDDGLRSWGDHPPGPVASPLIPNGSGRWLVVPGTGNDEGVTCRDGSMAQHDLGGECSRAHSGFALGGVSGLRAVASGTSLLCRVILVSFLFPSSLIGLCGWTVNQGGKQRVPTRVYLLWHVAHRVRLRGVPTSGWPSRR